VPGAKQAPAWTFTCGSEAKLQLEFDDTARETIQRPAELSGVGDIGWRSRRRQGFKIRYIEGIKEVAVELELGVLAKPARIRKEKVLTDERSSCVNPGPSKILRPAAPPGLWYRGGRGFAAFGKLAAGFGNTPFCQSCFEGLAIFPPV